MPALGVRTLTFDNYITLFVIAPPPNPPQIMNSPPPIVKYPHYVMYTHTSIF